MINLPRNSGPDVKQKVVRWPDFIEKLIFLAGKGIPPMRISTVILCFVFLACPLLGQTNPNASQQRLVSAGYTVKSGGIVETGMLALKGSEITTAASLTKCRGDCEITIHHVILKADELDLHPNTGEVEARGNVRIKVLPLGAAAVH